MEGEENGRTALHIVQLIKTHAPTEFKAHEAYWSRISKPSEDALQRLVDSSLDGLAVEEIMSEALEKPLEKALSEGRYQDAMDINLGSMCGAGSGGNSCANIYGMTAHFALASGDKEKAVMYATHALCQTFAQQTELYDKFLSVRWTAFEKLGKKYEALNDLALLAVLKPEHKPTYEAKLAQYVSATKGLQHSVCVGGGYYHYGKMKKCGGCMSVRYCTRVCQTESFPAHKKVCKKKQEATTTASGTDKP